MVSLSRSKDLAVRKEIDAFGFFILFEVFPIRPYSSYSLNSSIISSQILSSLASVSFKFFSV
jgi:hypothetical protein